MPWLPSWCGREVECTRAASHGTPQTVSCGRVTIWFLNEHMFPPLSNLRRVRFSRWRDGGGSARSTTHENT
eukprot:m.477123 g.477123  ORF g.477123 m.477123 type:complete len:71 (+) comp42950_c0_seq1:134-346(+)